jgi:hypothetical protein
MTEVTARPILDFADVLAGRYLIDVCITSSLDPVILSLDREPDYRQGCFPKKRAAQLNSFRIHHTTEAAWASVDLDPTDENYHKVQSLPEQQWLLTRGRAADARDRNAHVYSAEGHLVRSFHAGDAIEDVQTTDQGRVWISYFDEGVFGNTPLGNSGLACLDRHGRPLFAFSDLGVSSLADCYALNVSSNQETWLVTLGAMRAKKLKATDEQGRRLGPFRAMGRGSYLHLATEKRLYRLDLGSM